jgi:small subunit ribosomal protein S1
MSKATITMDDLLAEHDIKQLKSGDVVEGVVNNIKKHEVWIDLGANGLGVVMRREVGGQQLEIGQEVVTSVVEPEMDEGYALLSMRRAAKDRGWDELQRVFDSQEIITIRPYDANRGGLLVELEGIRGFLPVSQLSAGHYPRVSGADKDEILQKLNQLTNKDLRVRVLDISRKDNKLIFSEKDPSSDEKEKIMDHYALGDELDGEVTGIVDFGIFVKIEDGLEGLVHISEIDWGLVDNPHKFAKVGEKVKVKVIEVKDGKVSLSMKALKENPWSEAKKKYKKDDVVSGVIIKFNKHGALASIEEGVAGLVHVSEFGSEEKLREKLELGKTYNFKINLFDPKEQKMALSFIEK